VAVGRLSPARRPRSAIRLDAEAETSTPQGVHDRKPGAKAGHRARPKSTWHHAPTGQNAAMASANPQGWSPADNPYAIAVSEAQWWRDAARLAVPRMRDDDDRRIAWFGSQQIDARQLIFVLRQLLAAEHLEQVALAAVGIDPAVSQALTEARARFEQALPDIKHMRDALVHFDEWSHGSGKYGPQRKARDAGAALRDVAREFWSFGYDPSAGTVSLDPFRIHIDDADRAARELCHAIYLAARKVDENSTAELRTKTTTALTGADIACGPPAGS